MGRSPRSVPAWRSRLSTKLINRRTDAPRRPNDLTIKDVKARAVVAPLKRPVRTAVGTIPSAPLVLIDVLTEQQRRTLIYFRVYRCCAQITSYRAVCRVCREPTHLQGWAGMRSRCIGCRGIRSFDQLMTRTNGNSTTRRMTSVARSTLPRNIPRSLRRCRPPS
jgi:hypothetical protein